MQDILNKFRLTAKDKEAFKEALWKIIDANFETYENSYADIFKGLPYNVLEGMSEQQAAGFVSEVMKAATDNISNTMKMAREGLQNTLNDEEKMKELREKFVAKVLDGGEMTADVTEVPKSTIPEEGADNG